MSHLRTFFRHCPSCGRRFEIRLLNKQRVGSEAFEEKEKRFLAVGANVRPMQTVVQDDAPSIVYVEEFQYKYKCKHCGHEWSEVHQTEHNVDQPKGYTGD
jgi:hypothetical protein